jgi:predicted SnoaL-like aldol condensation-catalyzing enzyme
MGRKLDNVIALYVDGVAEGHLWPAADKYLAEDFVDRSGATTDGRRGFVGPYEPLLRRFPDRFVRPVRGFEDGSKVFLHSYQSFGRGQVSQVGIDVFDTDAEDHVTARWNVTVPTVPRSRSGRSQIDGPTDLTDLDRTDANKDLVRRFITDVMIDGRRDRLDRYVDPHSYAEHSPDMPEGQHGFRHRLDHHAAAGSPVRYHEIVLMVGRGNYVVTLSTATLGTAPYRVFDIYRIGGGHIVEHWDAAAGLS